MIKKKRYKVDDRVLLREGLIVASIISKLKKSDKYLVSFYLDNKFKYGIITEEDIVDEEEYEKIKNRNNLINKIL